MKICKFTEYVQVCRNEIQLSPRQKDKNKKKNFLTPHPNFREKREKFNCKINKNWKYIDFIITLLRKVMNRLINPTGKDNLHLGKYEI